MKDAAWKLELFLRSLDRKQVEAAAITGIFALGIGLIGAGAALFALGAGLVVTGVLVLASVVLYVRGTA